MIVNEGQEGKRVESEISKAMKEIMASGRSVPIKLMSDAEIDYYFEEHIEEVKNKVRSLDNRKYRGAKRNAEGGTRSVLDHYCSIDDVLVIKAKDDDDIHIAIDWTTEMSKIANKQKEHSKFNKLYRDILWLDDSLIVYIKNSKLVDETNRDVFVVNALKEIRKQWNKPIAKGVVKLDSKKLI